MKRICIIAALFIIFFSTAVRAADIVYTRDGQAIDHETITPGNTATAFTTTKIAPVTGAWAGKEASSALIQAKDNSINFCLDNTDPTQSTGTDNCHVIDSGQTYMIRGIQNVRQFKCIDRVSGSAGKLKVTYFFGGE